jgi:hypothetical protein
MLQYVQGKDLSSKPLIDQFIVIMDLHQSQSCKTEATCTCMKWSVMNAATITIWSKDTTGNLHAFLPCKPANRVIAAAF